MLRKLLSFIYSPPVPAPDDHPVFSIDLIRHNIFQFLPYDDLQNCRLVTSTWNYTATKLLLPRSCLQFHFVIGKRIAYRVKELQLERKKKLINKDIKAFINGSPPPDIQNLKIKIEYPKELDLELPGLDKSVLPLFTYYSTSLHKLEYTTPVGIHHLSILQNILTLLPGLNKLKLNLIFNNHEVNFPSIMVNMPSPLEHIIVVPYCSNNICKVKVCKRFDAILADVLSAFAPVLPYTNILRLQGTPCNPIYDTLVDDLRSKISIPTTIKIETGDRYLMELCAGIQYLENYLTSLCISWGSNMMRRIEDQQVAKAYEDILWNNSHTLTYLKCITGSLPYSSDDPVEIVIPVLPVLKTLKVIHQYPNNPNCAYNYRFKFSKGRRQYWSEHLDYSIQFPMLLRLSFVGEDLGECPYNGYGRDTGHFGSSFYTSVMWEYFIPPRQVPAFKCTTLRYFDFINFPSFDLEEHLTRYYKMSLVDLFPNVQNPNLGLINWSRGKLRESVTSS